ncbi:flagellar hook-length control protein FliK [Butyrivibrio proteoclasticus]|uniref:Flagellar hook-length control protein FliK n=1 Tax=Butyrivibrio proteoclasticus TaxID=43305 RepID=A0A1I5QII9_9FIRM|nr:flagellar hook-length control protein FliK [Butyrivibrio proteoclasticus]SFP45927.1 flagellar hook-length control protein FliK [Butyrivibrio proteoclasticus]
MSSTANCVGAFFTYMTQSAAAVNTSSVKDLKNNNTEQKDFNSILNKTSEKMVQNKDVSAKTAGEETDIETRAELPDQNEPEKADIIIVNDQDNVIDENLLPERSEEYIPEIVITTDENVTVSAETDEELQKAIGEAGKEIVTEIAETFEISEEDVLNAMEILGLMVVDLLKPENVQNLVTEVLGEDKALDLITDTDLYTKMQDLMEGADSMRSELLNEFDLSEEDLNIAISEYDSGFVTTLDENVTFKPEKTIAKDSEVVAKEPEIVVKEPEIVVKKAVDKISEDIKAPQSKKQTPEVAENTVSDEVTEFEPVEKTFDSSSSGNQKETKGGLNQNTNNFNLFNQLLNNITDSVDMNTTGTVSYTDRAQLENIVRQITEKITISAGNGESSMELQLHPAHLGNVNILLTSTKDGIVAKFTAQNELVKEAVESQMVALQQKFDEQGVKVTAIEVTIASHAFEQNLEQNKQEQEFEQAQGKFRKATRRINLSELEDDDMSEEDLMAAKVMEMNGNTVDYSA